MGRGPPLGPRGAAQPRLASGGERQALVASGGERQALETLLRQMDQQRVGCVLSGA